MWGFEAWGLPINAAAGTITVPLWAAGVMAALLLVFFILALVRTGLAGTLVFMALVGFGIWGAWRWSDHEWSAQRRALEQRLAIVEAQAFAPASVLACLDVSGGETIAASCERAIFGAAETVAAASALTAARVLLLQDAQRFLDGRDPGFESLLEGLRTVLEADRHGIVAQVFAGRKGCSAENCDVLRLLRDAARVRANMRDHTFETIVARYAPAWPNHAALSSNAAPSATGTIAGMGPIATPVPPRYTLPSAASIPPVSIMNNEPPAGGPAGTPSATESGATSATPSPPRRPAARPPAARVQAAQPSPPIPLTPTPPPRP
jgi:hypothetical protein